MCTQLSRFYCCNIWRYILYVTCSNNHSGFDDREDISLLGVLTSRSIFKYLPMLLYVRYFVFKVAVLSSIFHANGKHEAFCILRLLGG